MKRPPLPCSSHPPACASQREEGESSQTLHLASAESAKSLSCSCFLLWRVFLFFFFFNFSGVFFWLFGAGKRSIQALEPPGIAGWAKHQGVVLWNMSPGKLLCLYWLVQPASHLANTISPCDSVTDVTLSVKICETWSCRLATFRIAMYVWVCNMYSICIKSISG